MSDFLEKTLEDIIFNNQDKISEKDFPFLLSNTKRQFILPSGKKIDLFSFGISDNAINCRIFELKKEEIGIASLCQILVYFHQVYELLCPHFQNVSIENYLIGKKVSPELMLISHHIIDVEIYEYAYNFDGIKFKKQNQFWELSNEQINPIFPPTENSKKFYKELLIVNYPNLKDEITSNI